MTVDDGYITTANLCDSCAERMGRRNVVKRERSCAGNCEMCGSAAGVSVWRFTESWRSKQQRGAVPG